MPVTITRRHALIGTAAGCALPALGGAARSEDGGVGAIEADIGGRIGVFALDTGSGRTFGYREAERFPICSTFKMLAAALVLHRVDRGEEQLERRVTYGREILVPYSPETEKHAGADGMTMAAICRAAVTKSDNTAGNLMLASFGGPAGLTAFLRATGDEVGRLDRTEPTLNEALPGDLRDTSTPAAMAATARRLLLEDVLSTASRKQLAEWLEANETGAARIRAACPPEWRVGDKTGTGERNAASDVAIAWPPGRAPLLIAIYTHDSPKPLAEVNAAIAASARAAIAAVG